MKKITGYVKLQLPAGKANPSPPVGPALGQHGVNIMAFCKDFNSRTAAQGDMIIPVVITVYSDRSFTFIMKTPPASVLLKKAAGLATTKKPGAGSKEPNKVKVGKVTAKQLTELAELKMQDMNTTNLESAKRSMAGTARSMGIEIEGLTAIGRPSRRRRRTTRAIHALAAKSVTTAEWRAVGGESRTTQQEAKCRKTPRNK